jgi:acyl-CoA thioester hydrolase
MSSARFVWPVRVYYEDTDAAGIVYHANYLRFMERGRTEWLRKLGFEQGRVCNEDGVVFVITRTDVEYLSAARFDQELLVVSALERVRRASMTFHQCIEDSAGRAVCRATNTVACVDAASLAPRRIPAHMMKVLDSAQ